MRVERAVGRLSSVEITGHGRELAAERGRAFLERARAALRALPRVLVVHLVKGVRAEPAARARLEELRRLAEGQGTRLLVKSSDGALLQALDLQDLDAIPGVAA